MHTKSWDWCPLVKHWAQGGWQHSLPEDAVLPRQQAERPVSSGRGCTAYLLTPSLPTIFSS